MMDTVTVNNNLYDSVFVYEGGTVFGINKLYYKKGVGFIKYENQNNEIWNLKEKF